MSCTSQKAVKTKFYAKKSTLGKLADIWCSNINVDAVGVDMFIFFDNMIIVKAVSVYVFFFFSTLGTSF